MPRIIGLAGLIGSGKTTVANQMTYSGWDRLAFGDAVKEAARVIFGLTDDQLYGDAKNTLSVAHDLTSRYILQRLGTEVVRSIHPDAWILAAKCRIDALPDDACIVVDDVRFQNEVDAIHRWGGKVIAIHRDVKPGSNMDVHSSEHPEALVGIDGDVINDSSVNVLMIRIVNAIANAGGGHV